MSRFDHVLSPLKLGNKVLRNRVCALPMMPFPLCDIEHRVTDKFVDHFVSKAEGGAAMVAMSGAAMMPGVRNGDGTYDIFDVVNARPLTRLINKMHAAGALLIFEDYPGTLDVSEGYSVCGNPVLGAGHDPDSMGYQGKVMTPEMMDIIAERYANAVLRMKELGADGILMHFTHDPIGQFLNPLVNLRTDEYGGSLENRWRFPLMVIDRVRSKVGKDMILWMRTAGVDPYEGGLTMEDCIGAAKLLEGKVDVIEFNEGQPLMSKPWEIVRLTGMPHDFIEPRYHLYIAKALKEAGIKTAIMATGGYQDPEEMEEILAEGSADLIGICRGWLADLNLMKKVYDGVPESIQPCVKCLKCVDTPLFLGCAINPYFGREYELKTLPAAGPAKRVAVVGGGPGGIYAATFAAERGHDVTLYEREDHLGGRLMFADKMPFKRSMLRYKNYLIRNLEKSGAKICLGCNVTRELLEKEMYDVVILAIGAENRGLPIPGMDKAVFAADVYEKNVPVTGKVAIIGGGVTGCETALHLAGLGHEVSLFETVDRLCANAHIEYSRLVLYPLQNEPKIQSYTSALVKKYEDGTVVFVQDGEEKFVEADTVILSVGFTSRTDQALELWLPGSKTIMIGDCAKASDLKNAITQAFDAVLHI